MKYFLMVALFAIGVGVGVLITPEPPKGYDGFVSVGICNERIQEFENIAEQCVKIAMELVTELDACQLSK